MQKARAKTTENKLGLGGECINDIAARDWSSDHTPNLNEETK